jgi:hypothetical protein
VTGTGDEPWDRIEATQASLRKSIEKAKELASQSERLIRRHRAEAADPEDAPPA